MRRKVIIKKQDFGPVNTLFAVLITSINYHHFFKQQRRKIEIILKLSTDNSLVHGIIRSP